MKLLENKVQGGSVIFQHYSRKVMKVLNHIIQNRLEGYMEFYCLGVICVLWIYCGFESVLNCL